MHITAANNSAKRERKRNWSVWFFRLINLKHFHCIFALLLIVKFHFTNFSLRIFNQFLQNSNSTFCCFLLIEHLAYIFLWNRKIAMPADIAIMSEKSIKPFESGNVSRNLCQFSNSIAIVDQSDCINMAIYSWHFNFGVINDSLSPPAAEYAPTWCHYFLSNTNVVPKMPKVHGKWMWCRNFRFSYSGVVVSFPQVLMHCLRAQKSHSIFAPKILNSEFLVKSN